MGRKKMSNHHGRLNRRSFLQAAGKLAGGGLAVGATFETIWPSSAWGQQPAKETHPRSARPVDRLKTQLSFQISVDVGTLDLGLTVANAALSGGVNIVEMGTQLAQDPGRFERRARLPQAVSRRSPACRHEDHGRWRRRSPQCLRWRRQYL
jgi:hypothetical protein